MWKYRADEQAAMAFRDLASALDAGLPLDSLGGDPALGEHVLADLCERYGIVLSNAHDALADARATAMVLPALITEAGGLGALPEETLQVSP